eukprot:g74973.t1
MVAQIHFRLSSISVGVTLRIAGDGMLWLLCGDRWYENLADTCISYYFGIAKLNLKKNCENAINKTEQIQIVRNGNTLTKPFRKGAWPSGAPRGIVPIYRVVKTRATKQAKTTKLIRLPSCTKIGTMPLGAPEGQAPLRNGFVKVLP